MSYILNEMIALRSWWRVPYAYYVKGVCTAQKLTKEEFELLRCCDGQSENEKTESIQVLKGLIAGFRYDGEAAYEFKLYTDAACTEAYDPYKDTDSDLTIYVKWTNT